MKKLIILFAIIGVFAVVILKLDKITDYTSKIIDSTPSITIDKPNSYVYDRDYFYVQKSENFIPYSKQDIMNIFYSIFDNGYDTFTFYCPSEYAECMQDVEAITNDKPLMTNISNFVHPYNSFRKLKIVTGSLGEVNVIVTRDYSDDLKLSIDSQVDKILGEVTTEDMELEDKILAIHNYIIDHTSYDQENKNNSSNAYGALIEGSAKCAGYADAMAIFLSVLGVPNYKVASEKHVWNALYINNEWLQIDLTWDDPIVDDGINLSETIRHKFYMIDTPTLLSYDTKEHNFDTNVYLELKEKES